MLTHIFLTKSEKATNAAIYTNKLPNLLLGLSLLLLVIISLLSLPSIQAQAADKEVYNDGIYRYYISNTNTHEVELIGIETNDITKELILPSTATINEEVYSVTSINFRWTYYDNDSYKDFYKSVTKLDIPSSVTGSVSEVSYTFPMLNTIEFLGTTTPKEVYVSLSNLDIADFLFIVPAGTEDAYSNIIQLYVAYYAYSDLYEQDIKLPPTIVSDSQVTPEYTCLTVGDFIYKVTSSAKKATGKVQLIGLSGYNRNSYLAIPDTIHYQGYTYSVTSLARFSLVDYRANVIIVPDSVTEMESSVFDSHVELLFLSKNCKVVPSSIIADENNYSNLRYVYIPEGVSTISYNAFNDINDNNSSIILPSTIKSIGNKSLYAFKLITFLNKKPIDNIASAVKTGSTVKVNSASLTTFKNIFGKKATVTSAKTIKKSTTLSLNKSSLNLDTSKTYKLTGTLSKGSNETIYWMSTDTSVAEVSSNGIIVPKKAGTTTIVAYTRTSGLHQVAIVNVTDTIFQDGIYTYHITNPYKNTVTLSQVTPTASMTTLTIPSTVTYKNVKYTVTGVLADAADSSVPLISDTYSKNKITTITFPKNITGTLGNLGSLPKIKSITFLGTKAPDAIKDWYQDNGALAYKATIYVPKGCVDTYTSALHLIGGRDNYFGIHYGCSLDFNIVETGSKQVQRFVIDGILYRVTSYAGSSNGKVTVRGVDKSLTNAVINKTVTYNGFTYKVTKINSDATNNHPGVEFIIDKSIPR